MPSGATMQSYFVGVDIGGTFTDLVMLDSNGTIRFDKASTVPGNEHEGVLKALDNCCLAAGMQPADVLKRAARFSHGTTVGTNALIQRRGVNMGLITTRGFEDTVIIMRGAMGRVLGIPRFQAMDFIHTERPAPLPSKPFIQGVIERVDSDGDVVVPLDEAQARRAIAELKAMGIKDVAVCLLWSFKNDVHERQLGRLIEDAGLQPHLSADIAPLIGEYERSMTTVVNAYIAPLVSNYVNTLESRLNGDGFQHSMLIMKSSGGATVTSRVPSEAVALIDSGPVGGMVASQYLGHQLGYENVVCTDVGGTSFDVGVIYRGEPEHDYRPFVSQGMPVQIPKVKVRSIGAGGGSIARADGVRLTVGPESAGSVPGPVCYGQGGTEPTVTDALLTLGFIDPATFFSGRRKLDTAAAAQAIDRAVASPLGMSVEEAAAGIYEIVTAKMTDLIRLETIQSGHAPSDFALFAYGGAGPAHAAYYGMGMGASNVIIPPTCSVFSALGIALADVKYSYAKTLEMTIASESSFVEGYNAAFADLETRARADLQKAGMAAQGVVLVRRLDMRYRKQMKELTVTVGSEARTLDNTAELVELFEAAYERRFGAGTTIRRIPVQVVNFRVDAIVVSEKPRIPELPLHGISPADALLATRRCFYPRQGWLETPIYDRQRLAPGSAITGPALVRAVDHTTVLPPDFDLRVDQLSNLVITQGGGH